jgi:putative flippase GtrA
MAQQISIKKDLIISLIIGEIAVWLMLILAKGLLPEAAYTKIVNFLKVLPIVFPIVCAVCLYIAYLISKKIAVIYQIAKFVLVGGFNTLVDWGILTLAIFVFRSSFFIEPNTPLFTVPFIGVLVPGVALVIAYYSLYKTISFVLAVTSSYLWNKFWTFKREATEKPSQELLQFLIVTLLGFLINVGIASGIFKLFKPIAGLNYDQWAILAAVMATALSMSWNFLGYKFIVFEQKKPPEPEALSPEPAEPTERKII